MSNNSGDSLIENPSLRVAKDAAVHIAYILRDSEKQIINQASAKDGFIYLHGHENIVSGLEKALNGKEVGAKVSVVLTPNEGYGEYDPALIRKIERTQFPEKMRCPELGRKMQIEEDGHWHVWAVTAVDDTHITLNGNHELAGKDLYFEVEINGVRPATTEELDYRFKRKILP